MLDAMLKEIEANPTRAVFISRSGADQKQRGLAMSIADMLRAKEYVVVLQDDDFHHRNFMLAMDRALASGARVLALMSKTYLTSDYCMAEAFAAMGGPANAEGRLVLCQIDDCEPLGLLRQVRRFDLRAAWASGDAARLEALVIDALEQPVSARRPLPPSIDPTQIAHEQIARHRESAFTGREAALEALAQLLWEGAPGDAREVAVTRRGMEHVPEQALFGTAGIGKTMLARAYAFRSRDRYHGLWWIRAETEATMIEDLVALGVKIAPELARIDDRREAARATLGLIAEQPANRPWLLVYDNAKGPGDLTGWTPTANAHVLITSRYPHDWASSLKLGLMTEEEAVALLCGITGQTIENAGREAAALAELLGHLPLALAHAGSKCRGGERMSFSEYGERYRQFLDDKPGKRAAHGDYGETVWATFSIALDGVVAGDAAAGEPPCPEAETVMGLIAHLAPESIPNFILAALHRGLPGVPPVIAEDAHRRAIEALIDASLISHSTIEALIEGRRETLYDVHRLVQEVMRLRLEASGDLGAVAEQASALVEASYDDTGALVGRHRNRLWAPQARAALEHAPKDWPAAYHAVWTLNQIGDLDVARGDLTAAQGAFKDAQAILERALRSIQDDAVKAQIRRDLSVSHDRIGDVTRAQGRLDEALDAYRAALEIAKALAAADPGNAQSRRDLSVSWSRIGVTAMARGRLDEARKAFDAWRELIEQLCADDPGNADWRRDLAMSHTNIGDVARAQGRLDAALAAYRAGLEIAEALAAADPGNAEWRRGLSISHNKIGDVARAQGRLDEALAAYRAALEIAKALAAADPGNAQSRRDLSVSWSRIGDVARAQGGLDEALDAYRAGLEIAEALAAADPGNAEWRRDLAVSNAKLGQVHRGAGDHAAAAQRFAEAHASFAKLEADFPGHAENRRMTELARADLDQALVDAASAEPTAPPSTVAEPSEGVSWSRVPSALGPGTTADDSGMESGAETSSQALDEPSPVPAVRIPRPPKPLHRVKRRTRRPTAKPGRG